MKVSNSQLERLGQFHFQKFTEELVLHARTWFPEHVAASGDAAIRETIRLCIRRAKQYGFVSTRNITLYFNAMLAWGSFFDTDPQYPWAQQILNDRSIPNATTRINVLSDASESAWLRVQGGSQEHQLAGFAAILQDPDRSFGIIQSDEPQEMLNLLQTLHSQKAETLGADGLRELAARARTALNGLSLGHTGAESMITFLMTLWGTGLLQDPQLPWLEPILREISRTPEERQAALWAGTLSHLNQFLSPVATTVE